MSDPSNDSTPSSGAGSAVARIEARLLVVGSTRSGSDWLCPSHYDTGRSLTVRQGDKVKGAVIKCGAGCSTDAVLSVLDLSPRDMFDGPPDAVVDTKKYIYTDEKKKPLFRVKKLTLANGKKQFHQSGANGKGGWRKVVRDGEGKVVERPMDGVRLVLWRLPMVLRAVSDGAEIHLAEGEKDVVALAKAGVAATCHPMGAGKWRDEYTQSLTGAASVVVWADRDPAGYACAHRRLSALLGAGIPARACLPIPDHKGADAFDHLAAGHSPSDGKPVTLEELELLGTQSALGSWAPEDLSVILGGEFEPELPVVGTREGDGLALFYPGKLHLLIAESEAGKTWLALFAVKQEVEAGHHVFFYDFEDSAAGVVGRLVDMDTDRGAIAQFFHYIRPDEKVNEVLLAAIAALHCSLHPTLVVTDGVTEVMSQNGWGQSENNDIAQFYNTILKPMARIGAAVVALDHLPKYDEKGRGSIGGVHKLNGIDGAAYRLEADREITPGRVGRTRIKYDKDRPGQVKRHAAEKKRIADLIVDSEGDGPVLVSVWPPDAYLLDGETPSSELAPKKPSSSEEMVRASVQSDWTSTSTIINAVQEGHPKKPPSVSTIRRVLKELYASGLLEKAQETDQKNRKVDLWRRPE